MLKFAEVKELHYDTTAASASPSTPRDVVSIPLCTLMRMQSYRALRKAPFNLVLLPLQQLQRNFHFSVHQLRSSEMFLLQLALTVFRAILDRDNLGGKRNPRHHSHWQRRREPAMVDVDNGLLPITTYAFITLHY